MRYGERSLYYALGKPAIRKCRFKVDVATGKLDVRGVAANLPQ